MKWDALLAEVREDLADTSVTPKFSDQTLYVYLREALADYSQFLPLEKWDVTLTKDLVNLKKFALPADFLAEILVACPANRFLEPRRGRPGVNVAKTNRPFFYQLAGSYLLMDVEPGDDAVILSYKAQHPMPATKDDKTFELTVPLIDMELIKLYIKGRANTKLRNDQAKLDRFKIGAGTRTDNPIEEEVENFFDVYRHKIEERTERSAHILHRPRRYK
jgi:hypothetical protein